MSHTHVHDQPAETDHEDVIVESVVEPDDADAALNMATDPVADARRLLAMVEQANQQECAREIEAVLARYGYTLQVSQPSVFLAPVRG